MSPIICIDFSVSLGNVSIVVVMNSLVQCTKEERRDA